MFREFIEAFKLEVWARLQRKTGWGRKEVMGEFEAALNTVLMRLY